MVQTSNLALFYVNLWVVASADTFYYVLGTSHNFYDKLVHVYPLLNSLFAFLGFIGDCYFLTADGSELQTSLADIEVPSVLELQVAFDLEVSLVFQLYFLTFFKTSIVGGKTQFYIFGGDVQVDKSNVGSNVYLKDMVPIDRIIQGQRHGSKHVRFELNSELLFRFALNFHYLHWRTPQGLIFANVPLEQDRINVIVVYFYLFCYFAVDKDSPERYFAVSQFNFL